MRRFNILNTGELLNMKQSMVYSSTKFDNFNNL